MKKNKVIQWESNIDNKDYVFKYEKIKGELVLTVNDEDTVIKRESISIFLGADITFNFDGKEARFVQRGKKVDVFYDGFGLQSRQEYIPTPKWAWILIGLCLLIPIISGGFQSIFTAIIGFIGIFFYRIIAKKKPSLIIYDVITGLSVFRGGFFPIALGLVGADLCLKISRKKMTTLAKVLLCALAAIMTWVVTIIASMIFYILVSHLFR